MGSNPSGCSAFFFSILLVVRPQFRSLTEMQHFWSFYKIYLAMQLEAKPAHELSHKKLFLTVRLAVTGPHHWLALAPRAKKTSTVHRLMGLPVQFRIWQKTCRRKLAFHPLPDFLPQKGVGETFNLIAFGQTSRKEEISAHFKSITRAGGSIMVTLAALWLRGGGFDSSLLLNHIFIWLLL